MAIHTDQIDPLIDQSTPPPSIAKSFQMAKMTLLAMMTNLDRQIYASKDQNDYSSNDQNDRLQ